MLTPTEVKNFNALILQKLSLYLNLHSDFIEASIIHELVHECGLSVKEAFSLVLAQVCGLDIEENDADRQLYHYYFEEMIAVLDPSEYENNPYYKNIKIPNAKVGRWAFQQQKYKPYEAFVYKDLKKLADGRVLPQIGFFEKTFSYPAVLENNREWMLITPNEIETMKAPIVAAHGKVLTFGLGLGYYAYMVSEKENVSSITIVEKDANVIQLFKEYILPQFKHKDKVQIVHEDAFVYAQNHLASEQFDVVFTDIWHDPADGVDLYLKMKTYEKLSPTSQFLYWIEDTMVCYL